jgi:hypothetical protein
MASGGRRWVLQLEDGERSEARIFNSSKIARWGVSPWLGVAAALWCNSGGEEGLRWPAMARRCATGKNRAAVSFGCEENTWESFFRSRKALDYPKSATVQYCRGSTPQEKRVLGWLLYRGDEEKGEGRSGGLTGAWHKRRRRGGASRPVAGGRSAWFVGWPWAVGPGCQQRGKVERWASSQFK